MPAHKKHHTTVHEHLTTSTPDLSVGQAFHEHLRAMIRGATRVVLEEIMQEELTQFLQAGWNEHTPERKGYRNGTYTRDLTTNAGPIEDLAVPRDRAGAFQTQAFERYSRFEPQIAQALTEMFVSGSSTHKIGAVSQTLLGTAPSASTISRLNRSLDEQFETWRTRPLLPHYRIVYLDGIHFRIRHGSQCDASILLTVLAVDLEGNKEVVALRACAEESKEGWLGILQDIRTRGVLQIDVLITDGHEGLLAAVGELFTATPRQRCLVHKQRNVLSAVPRREREALQEELAGIWKAETKEQATANLAAFQATYAQRYPEAVRSLLEDAEHLFTFYAFPPAMWRHVQSTNPIESLFSNVRQRTDQIDAFSTETSCVRLVWAVMQDIRFHHVTVN
jgi:transposase-like protein